MFLCPCVLVFLNVLFRYVEWKVSENIKFYGEKKSVPECSPNDKGGSNSWFFCMLEICISFGGSHCKIWFCFLNCSVQIIFVHCNLFTSASVRPCPCLCLQLFFFSFQSLKSTVHLLASSVKCWKVFSIYSCAWITWVKILQINYICGF